VGTARAFRDVSCTFYAPRVHLLWYLGVQRWPGPLSANWAPLGVTVRWIYACSGSTCSEDLLWWAPGVGFGCQTAWKWRQRTLCYCARTIWKTDVSSQIEQHIQFCCYIIRNLGVSGVCMCAKYSASDLAISRGWFCVKFNSTTNTRKRRRDAAAFRDVGRRVGWVTALPSWITAKHNTYAANVCNI